MNQVSGGVDRAHKEQLTTTDLNPKFTIQLLNLWNRKPKMGNKVTFTAMTGIYQSGYGHDRAHQKRKETRIITSLSTQYKSIILLIFARIKKLLQPNPSSTEIQYLS